MLNVRVQNLSKVALYCKTYTRLMLRSLLRLNQKSFQLGAGFPELSLEDLVQTSWAYTTVIHRPASKPPKVTGVTIDFTQLQTWSLHKMLPGGINAWNTIHLIYIDNQFVKAKRLCILGSQKCPENGSLPYLMVQVFFAVCLCWSTRQTFPDCPKIEAAIIERP